VVSFILLQDLWSVVKSLETIETLKKAHPSHVIVHRSDEGNDYYLFTLEEILELLKRYPNASSLRITLNLQRADVVQALAGTTNAESAPDRCIILADDRVVGFFDASIPPSLNIRRGSSRPTNTMGEPVTNRTLLAEFPEQVTLGDTVSLLVALSAAPTEDRAIPLTLPLNATVDIVVQVRSGFILEGKTEGSIVVTDIQGTLPIQFKLRGTALGPGQIRVLALHNGIALGMLTLTPMVIEVPTSFMTTRSNSHEQILAPVSVRLPDLSLLIVETQVNGLPGFTLWLNSQDPVLAITWKKFGPIILRTDPRPYFQEFYKDIEGYPVGTPTERAVAAQKIAGKGDFLFSMLFPPEVQSLLWSLKDRIKSVLVQSEEPWIPWELCKLSGRENGRVVEGPFLCEAFIFTRWIPGISLKPTLKLQNMAVVVPSDSNLPYASTELNYLLSLVEKKRKVTRIPARFLDIQSVLASGECDGWHFTGHGASISPDPNRSAIYLEDKETFTPENIVGVVTNLGNAQPLVFLNACQIGRSGMSLTDIGGWASQFLHAGAAAFIGAYWSVYDRPACDFSK